MPVKIFDSIIFGLHTAILHTTQTGVTVGLSLKCVTEKHTGSLCIPVGKWSQSSQLAFCVCLVAVCSCQGAGHGFVGALL